MDKFSPRKADREVTTIRIPKSLLDIVDRKSYEYGLSRNEMINQCIEYALDHLEEKE